jgi:hypothetical protein
MTTPTLGCTYMSISRKFTKAWKSDATGVKQTTKRVSIYLHHTWAVNVAEHVHRRLLRDDIGPAGADSILELVVLVCVTTARVRAM